MIRPEFAALRPYSLSRRLKGELKHLLISLGGVDEHNVTAAVLKSLPSCELPADCCITVVLGPTALWIEQVMNEADKLPWVTNVILSAANMAELMADIDMAVGAAGSTSWERCCLGLPSLIVALSDNQEFIASALDRAGAARRVSRDTLSDDLENYLSGEFILAESLASVSRMAAGITDGKGAPSVCNALIKRSGA